MRFVGGEFVPGRQFAGDQQIRRLFNFAMFRVFRSVVAAVMQFIAAFTHGAVGGIARRNSRKRDRFFRFNVMGPVFRDRCVSYIFLVIGIICRVEIVV